MINKDTKRILVQPEESSSVTKQISGNFSQSNSLFVSISGDIYVDVDSNRVEKWNISSNQSTTVMFTNGNCFGLFIDLNNTLYCSLTNRHLVIKSFLDDGTNSTTIAAGNGSKGSAANMLNSPRGIYVDSHLDLYVADCSNDRVQMFRSGELNGTTIVGGGTANVTFILDCPTGIAFDADQYIFIVDNEKARIVGSRPNGFRCLVGCSNSKGSALNQLNNPDTLHFDSYGNMFVTDRNNSRIQKFIFANNSCGKYN